MTTNHPPPTTCRDEVPRDQVARDVAVAGALGLTVAAAQSPAEMEKHIAAAKAAAGTDHPGIFDRICTEARTVGAPRGGGAGGAGAGRRGGGPPPPPARETWHAEPAKVFDNMYYVGMTEYSSWAITTSQGIILIDAIYDYSVEDEVVGGLKKLGLKPADIKYVLVSHGHLDHAGGAKYLQDKFGARILMSAADWDLLEQQNPPWKPKRDMVVDRWAEADARRHHADDVHHTRTHAGHGVVNCAGVR